MVGLRHSRIVGVEDRPRCLDRRQSLGPVLLFREHPRPPVGRRHDRIVVILERLTAELSEDRPCFCSGPAYGVGWCHPSNVPGCSWSSETIGGNPRRDDCPPFHLGEGLSRPEGRGYRAARG